MDFIKGFRTARKVSTPLVAIRTFDAASTVKAIRDSFTKPDEVPLLLWDCMNGLGSITTKGKIDLQDVFKGDSSAQDASIQISSTLHQLAEASKRLIPAPVENLVVFISNAHLVWAEPAIIQAIWNVRDTFKANGNMLVMLCSPGATLPVELVSDILVIEEPLPTMEELEKIVQSAYTDAGLPLPDKAVLVKSTDALIGLPAFSAEQASAMCLETTGTLKENNKKGTMNITELWSRKRQIIGQAPGMTVWQGKERMEDVGGLSEIKLFLKDIFEGVDPPKVILFMDEVEKAVAGTGTETSGVKTELTGGMLSWMQDTDMDGLIAIGPPGVSKSALAKAAGGTYGVPVIKFDLAGMQSSLVGSSNANLRAAQKTVDAISGGRVLAIATCNSIQSLPPELRRRFNMGIFFFDIPGTQKERDEIWRIWRKAYCIPDKESNPPSEGWTGAEIKQCCLIAHKLGRTLAQASGSIVPITTSSPDTIRGLRQMCNGRYLNASAPGVYEYKPNAVETAMAFTETGRKVRD